MHETAISVLCINTTTCQGFCMYETSIIFASIFTPLNMGLQPPSPLPKLLMAYLF